MTMVMKFLLLQATLICLLLSSSSSILFVESRRFIVFAGPHETWGSEVSKFLQSNAVPGGSGSTDSDNDNGPFKNWAWPDIENGRSPHHAFDALVAATTADVNTNNGETALILDGIKSAWDQAPSDGGVIIGSMNFDKVGPNPDTGYDPIGSVQQVVDYIGVEPEHVTVVMNYRTPKDEHWSDVYMNHFDDGQVSYEQFICGDRQGPKKWEWVDTVMNPLKVAEAYHDEGYHVRMVDVEGTFSRNQDPAHVFACRVLRVECDDNDYVLGIDSNTTGINPSDGQDVIPGLSDVELDELEAVFNQRDCHYKYALDQEERFHVYNGGTHYWKECGGTEFSKYYRQFTDTNFMVRILQSQKGCASGGDNIDIVKLLNDRDKYAVDGGEDPISNGNDDDSKKLLFFAGIHGTKSSDINKFLVDHAVVADDQSDTTLQGWIWPALVDDKDVVDKQPYRTFDLLVTEESDKSIQSVLLDSIRDSWHDAQDGVIIGSSEFANIGLNPYTGYDSLGAIQRLVAILKNDDNVSSNDDVTVALTYVTPKVDHFSTIWSIHFDEANDYRSFICNDDQSDKRWEYLDTAMNPLKIAHAYTELGLNAVVIDADGTESRRKDVAHSIACDVMGVGNCQDGWVIGLESETVDMTYSTKQLRVIDALTEQQLRDLEALFLMRDCHYWLQLSTSSSSRYGTFSTVNSRNIGDSCSREHLGVYQQLADTDFFLNAIRAQLNCERQAVDLTSLLSASPQVSSLSTGDGGIDVVGLFVILIAVFVVIGLSMGMFIMKRRASKTWNSKAPPIHAPNAGVFRDSPTVTNIQSYSDEGDNVTTNPGQSQQPKLCSDSDGDFTSADEAVMA
mmetsp:Transcript_36296/g.87525  ORF Transcript_36296/g.87525 Transcript_36296/m.87525 type:complete len:846 (-) Transcript_36296:3086-5623(-)